MKKRLTHKVIRIVVDVICVYFVKITLHFVIEINFGDQFINNL